MAESENVEDGTRRNVEDYVDVIGDLNLKDLKKHKKSQIKGTVLQEVAEHKQKIEGVIQADGVSL